MSPRNSEMCRTCSRWWALAAGFFFFWLLCVFVGNFGTLSSLMSCRSSRRVERLQGKGKTNCYLAIVLLKYCCSLSRWLPWPPLEASEGPASNSSSFSIHLFQNTQDIRTCQNAFLGHSWHVSFHKYTSRWLSLLLPSLGGIGPRWSIENSSFTAWKLEPKVAALSKMFCCHVTHLDELDAYGQPNLARSSFTPLKVGKVSSKRRFRIQLLMHFSTVAA